MEGNYKKWKDRINSKQDILTEDNVGEFMDLELATKSTPTSGDTVLGRDSLTGKAVEIPTSSLGGSGGSLAFNVKVTNPSSWVTGTMSETEVLRIEIPANSLSDSDVLRIPFLMINKVGTAGTIFIRGKLSTSATMPSGTTDQLFQTPSIAATNQYVGLDRQFIIGGGQIKGYPFTSGGYSGISINSNQIASKAFDRTVTNYLYIAITLGNSADQARLEGIQITNS